MTAIPLGVGNYVRQLGKLPPIFLTNMFVEKDPSNIVDGLARLQRAGLTLFASTGAGPIKGVFQQSGTFGGDYLVVSGTGLYRVTSSGTATLLDTIDAPGRVIIAASATRALIATGNTCYSTDGVSVTTVAVPDIDTVPSPISSVSFIDGYFILTVANSQHFFWLAPGDTDPDALNFASAENAPDNLSLGVVLFDEIWFPGEGNSTEVWQPTGNLDLPFQRIQGRLYNIGCANRSALATIDNTLFWPGTDGKVYRAGQNSPERVSDHAIEEAIRINNDSSTLSAWAFSQDGHSFYVLTIGAIGTFVIDIENPTAWLHWHTYQRTTWRAWIGTSGNGAPIVAGDDTNGLLYTLAPGKSNDNGAIMLREIVGGVVVLGKPQRCDNVAVIASTGWTADINAEPVMELNWSDDGGITYPGPWMPMSLGRQGQYGLSCQAWQLGIIDQPGRLFKLRMMDDAVWRVSYARMNEL